MIKFLEEIHAVQVAEKHWKIINPEMGWEIDVFQDVYIYSPFLNDICPEPYPWKVNGQAFIRSANAVKYLKAVIEEKNTGIRRIPHPKGKVPDICAMMCLHPNKCNAGNCDNCPAADEFFAKRDGVVLQYEESENTDED